jgi:opacity protein-like surface antigen
MRKHNLKNSNICILSVVILMLICSSNLFSYGDSIFYIGASIDAFNPKEEVLYFDDGFPFGFGINFGLNITPHLSFPDISGKLFRITDQEGEDSGYMEYDKVQYVVIGLGVKYRFGDYRLQPFAKVGFNYENIRVKFGYVDHYPEIEFVETTYFIWGFALYIGAGLSYYISDDMALGLELVYSNGRGTFKTGEHQTYPLGGTDISSSFTWYPF